MPGRIRREDIDTLREQADLADLAADHTRLKRSGSRLKGLCPFHEERTPSFTLDPGRNLWHCFGCGEGGDIFTFLQRVEGLTFVEAVERLARRTGMRLRYEELSPGEKRALGERTRLVEVTSAALEYFRQCLLDEVGAPAREYLESRGYGREEAERFQLGFAPDKWEALSRHLRRLKFDPQEVVRAGLALRTERGGLRDRFRGRLIFPVFDLGGEPIGFGGRVLPGLDYGGHDPPKYLNTPETPLYHKQRVLYGMSWARPAVVRSGEVLVCEGYTDVMGLHRAGMTNAVATCGTAVGEDHLRLLERYADRVVLAFDADAAGGRAARRAFDLSRDRDLEVRVLVLPEGVDPADLVEQDGPQAVRESLEQATPVVPFVLRRVLADQDLASPEGRAAAVKAAAPILAAVPDPVLRYEYARREVADAVGLNLEVVRQAVEAEGGDIGGAVGGAGLGSGRARRQRAGDGAGRDGAVARARLEREVLRIVLQQPELLPDRWEEVDEEDFTHPDARGVLAAIRSAGGPGADPVAAGEVAADDRIRDLVRAIALEDVTVEPDAAHVAMLVNRLLLPRVERRIREEKGELERLNPTTDPEEYRSRFEDLVVLEARRRELLAVEE